jgi:hypothetical protein
LLNGKVRITVNGIPKSELRAPKQDLTPEAVGRTVYVALRPEAISAETVDERTDALCSNELSGHIEAVLFVGDRFESSIQVGGERLIFYLPRNRSWHEGQRVKLSFPEEAISIWPA